MQVLPIKPCMYHRICGNSGDTLRNGLVWKTQLSFRLTSLVSILLHPEFLRFSSRWEHHPSLWRQPMGWMCLFLNFPSFSSVVHTCPITMACPSSTHQKVLWFFYWWKGHISGPMRNHTPLFLHLSSGSEHCLSQVIRFHLSSYLLQSERAGSAVGVKSRCSLERKICICFWASGGVSELLLGPSAVFDRWL